jgi:hypothetical protein
MGFVATEYGIQFHNPRFSRPKTRIHIGYVFSLQIKRASKLFRPEFLELFKK